MFNEFRLPDGTMATCVQDVERYMRESGSAPASDYSDEFYKNRRYFNEKAQDEKLHADFVYNLKKEIWLNE